MFFLVFQASILLMERSVFSWAVVEVAGSLILDVFEGSYEAYLKSMAMDGTWGDHVTLQVGKTATP